MRSDCRGCVSQTPSRDEAGASASRPGSRLPPSSRAASRTHAPCLTIWVPAWGWDSGVGFAIDVRMQPFMQVILWHPFSRRDLHNT